MNRNKDWKYQSQIPNDNDGPYWSTNCDRITIVNSPNKKPIIEISLLRNKNKEQNYDKIRDNILTLIKKAGIRMINFYNNGAQHIVITLYTQDDAVAVKMMFE